MLLLALLTLSASAPNAENYVNWKGGFWLEIPDDWEKVGYHIVDRYLAATDTSREVFDYEAVFAPGSAENFVEGAYLVITFDSTGELNAAEVDSVLTTIAESYSTSVQEAPVVQYMSDLVPGQPHVDREQRVVTVLSEMGFRPEAIRKLWLYMQLNDVGLVSLYFYSPDWTFEQNLPIFEEVVNSLSYENLEAASKEELVFTDVTGDEDGSGYDLDVSGDEGGGAGIIPYLVLILIILYLLWRFAVAPRLRRKKTHPE